MSQSVPAIVGFEDLQAWVSVYVKDLKAGDCVCLIGPLGTGKTTLTRVLVTELGLDDQSGFGSPTFSVMNIYDARALYLRHLDLYRLESFASFEDLDLINELKSPDGISFVEWGDKFPELKKYFTHFIRLDFVPESADERFIHTWSA